MLFTVRCDETLAEGLAERVRLERQAERAWWGQQHAELPEGLSAGERARWLDAAQAEFNQLRAAGQLRGTRSALIVPALVEELDARGWQRRWRPVPEGAQSRQGRRWGTPDRGWPARFTVEVPDRIGTALVRATYWTSAPAVAELQRWYDTHGDGARGLAHGGRRWLGAGPTRVELARRDQAQAKVVTTSEVLRAAAHRALTTPPAPQS